VAYGDICVSQLAGEGGAIGVNAVSGYPLYIRHTNFTSNQAISLTSTATSTGGAIIITYGSNVSVVGCYFEQNQADVGNDIYSQNQVRNSIFIFSSRFYYSGQTPFVLSKQIISFSAYLCSTNSAPHRSLAIIGNPLSDYLNIYPSIAVTGGNAFFYNTSFYGKYHCFFGDYGQYYTELSTGVSSSNGAADTAPSAVIIPINNNNLKNLLITVYYSNLDILVHNAQATTLLGELNIFYGNFTFINDIIVLNTSFLYQSAIKGLINTTEYSNITFIGKVFSGYIVSALSVKGSTDRAIVDMSVNRTSNYSQNLLVFQNCYFVISGAMYLDAPFQFGSLSQTYDRAFYPAWLKLLDNATIVITLNGSLNIGTKTLISHFADYNHVVIRNYGRLALSGAAQSPLIQEKAISKLEEAGSLTSPVTVVGLFSQSQDGVTFLFLNHTYQNTSVLHLYSNQFYEGSVEFNFYTSNGVYNPNLQLSYTSTPSNFEIIDFAHYSSSYSFDLLPPLGTGFKGTKSGKAINGLQYTEYDVTVTNIGCEYIYDFYADVSSSGSQYYCWVCTRNSSCEMCDGQCVVKGQCYNGTGSTSCCSPECNHGQCQETSTDHSSFDCRCSPFYTGSADCGAINIAFLLAIVFPMTFVLLCCLTLYFAQNKTRIQEIIDSFYQEVFGMGNEKNHEEGIELSASAELVNLTNLEFKVFASSILKKLPSNEIFTQTYHCKIGNREYLAKQFAPVYFPSTSKNRFLLQKEIETLKKIHHRNICVINGFTSLSTANAAEETRKVSERKRTISFSFGTQRSVVPDNFYVFLEYSSRYVLLADVIIGRRISNFDNYYGFILMIAVQIARGILILHHHQPSVFNLNLNLFSILVNTNDWNVKIMDYFQNQVISHETLHDCIDSLAEETSSGSQNAHLNYFAPEMLSLSTKRISSKVDIYAFGIILWELWDRKQFPEMERTDKKPKDVNNTGSTFLPRFSEIDHDVNSCPWLYQSLIEECISANPMDRPAINSVIHQLNQQIMNLPSSERQWKGLESFSAYNEVDRRNPSSRLITDPVVNAHIMNPIHQEETKISNDLAI
jgi:hypothetical protein